LLQLTSIFCISVLGFSVAIKLSVSLLCVCVHCLERPSPKWPILCRAKLQTSTHWLTLFKDKELKGKLARCRRRRAPWIGRTCPASSSWRPAMQWSSARDHSPTRSACRCDHLWHQLTMHGMYYLTKNKMTTYFQKRFSMTKQKKIATYRHKIFSKNKRGGANLESGKAVQLSQQKLERNPDCKHIFCTFYSHVLIKRNFYDTTVGILCLFSMTFHDTPM